MAIGVIVSGLATLSVAAGWVHLSTHVTHWGWVEIQLTFFVAGGISLLALVVSDAWKNRDADSSFLTVWMLGTYVFAVYLNWTTNGRSILPMIPPAGILIARRLEATEIGGSAECDGCPRPLDRLCRCGLGELGKKGRRRNPPKNPNRIRHGLVRRPLGLPILHASLWGALCRCQQFQLPLSCG
jgi:hypothetical protein